MCVGYHATDEVGLGLVKGGHQVIQLALEVGGHSLSSFSLLPLLVLGCFLETFCVILRSRLV